jgi:hypothetical protein
MFKKSLIDLTELEIKHAKNQVQLIKATLETLKDE